MQVLIRLIEFFETILTKLIEKLNFVTIMIILVVLGIWNQETVFEWFKIVGKMFKTTFSFQTNPPNTVNIV